MQFLNRSDTNQSLQSQKMVRSLKFWIEKEEELYYLCSENRGFDQLGSYCEADLHLCFCICRLWVFSLHVHDSFITGGSLKIRQRNKCRSTSFLK